MANIIGGYSPQYVHPGSLDGADIVEQGQVLSPKKSPNLPPVQTFFSDNTINNGSVAEGLTPTSYHYDQQSQISPKFNFSTTTYYGQESQLLNGNFDDYSSHGSNYSGIETIHLDDDNDFMNSMLPSTSQDQDASQNLKNVQVGKEEKKKGRGRPRKQIEVESPKHKKNTYMQNYHQKLVKNCEKNEELVNLYEQLIEILPAHIFNSLKARELYKRIEENKKWLQDDKNRRSSSKLLFPKKK
uniref:BHLH domain-containing protein n=1 Tax=Acrobeloides nanus TaxID=290746 RepID=A0A914CSK2_9BILA